MGGEVFTVTRFLYAIYTKLCTSKYWLCSIDLVVHVRAWRNIITVIVGEQCMLEEHQRVVVSCLQTFREVDLLHSIGCNGRRLRARQ